MTIEQHKGIFLGSLIAISGIWITRLGIVCLHFGRHQLKTQS